MPSKTYYQSHKDYYQRKNAEYKLINKERLNLAQQRWFKINQTMEQKKDLIYAQTHPEARAFYRAKYRCTNRKCVNYKDYGGRGIKFLFTHVQELLNDIGNRPSKHHTLDRINNNGHYEAGNIRWATRKKQANNRRIRKDAQ